MPVIATCGDLVHARLVESSSSLIRDSRYGDARSGGAAPESILQPGGGETDRPGQVRFFAVEMLQRDQLQGFSIRGGHSADPASVSDETGLKPRARSTPIAIKAKPVSDERFFCDDFSSGNLSLSELWAGPAYSNSPPPSSLPIPKFSLRPKRTVSLDLPGSAPDGMVMHRPIAKSAPASPTRDCKPSAKAFFHSADSATETLRRILNLDVTDE
ncbi:hypothetical protein NL676_023262 [Syzygium grande]|nr:hypothetical protein NL676_023262 [Syzygium grande]